MTMARSAYVKKLLAHWDCATDPVLIRKSVDKHPDGTTANFVLKVTCPVVGQHQLSVLFDDEHVLGSPFTVNVTALNDVPGGNGNAADDRDGHPNLDAR